MLLTKRFWQVSLFSLISWMVLATPVLAFDTGHHSDLTYEVMAEQGFNQTAIEVAKVENWLVDYYSSQPVAGLKEKLALLHFDNLFTEEAIDNTWSHLALNTKNAIQKAAREQDPLKIIALAGISLHAVQDFYTHSNWEELYPAQGDAFNTTTWFESTRTDHAGVYTGRYDRPGAQPEHGNYDTGLNHDSYNRPNWENAYVFAYSGSRQWLFQIQQWVNEIDPEVWAEAQNLQLSDDVREGLSSDLQAAYRLSEWIDIEDEDGHWKGKGSGSNSEFLAFVTAWTASPDSIFVDHFKEQRWFAELLPGLEGTRAPTDSIPTIETVPMEKQAVIVRTLRVEEDDVSFLELAIDPTGSADFYANITIAGQSFIESMQLNQSKINPDWTSIKFVDLEQTSVPIRYELWDEDNSIRGNDDLCDIKEGSGYPLEFALSTDTSVLSGDVDGRYDSEASAITSQGNESDRAGIRFFVTQRPLK